MKFVYLEAGSGAAIPVSPDIVKAVHAYINLPIIVGGGITDPDYAAQLVAAGASFIVIGNALENDTDGKLAALFAEAIHEQSKGIEVGCQSIK